MPVEVSLGGVNHVDALFVEGFHPIGIDYKGDEKDCQGDYEDDKEMFLRDFDGGSVCYHFVI